MKTALGRPSCVHMGYRQYHLHFVAPIHHLDTHNLSLGASPRGSGNARQQVSTDAFCVFPFWGRVRRPVVFAAGVGRCPVLVCWRGRRNQGRLCSALLRVFPGTVCRGNPRTPCTGTESRSAAAARLTVSAGIKQQHSRRFCSQYQQPWVEDRSCLPARHIFLLTQIQTWPTI
jgi:hypothetical protein